MEQESGQSGEVFGRRVGTLVRERKYYQAEFKYKRG